MRVYLQNKRDFRARYRLVMLSISLMLILIISNNAFGQFPLISSVVPENSVIPKYSKFQVDVNLGMAYFSNPFDPYDIDIKLKLTGPSNQKYVINGFWNGSDWLIRFSPNEAGIWSYYAWVNDYSRTDSSSVETFTCTESDYHAFIRVSDNNPHYLEYSDDTPFYGIGQCRCWHIYEQVPNIFVDMKNAGMNTLVYWMPDWDNMLVTNITGYDSYDMSRAAEIDQIVEDCENNNITLILTIWNHDEIRGAGHPWNIRPYYDEYNPFRNLVSPVNLFFTEDTSWYYQEWLYRYIVARWGYSQAIQQWHTVCEMNGTGNSSFSQENSYDYRNLWMVRINNWFRDNDPFGHPVTSSLSYDAIWNHGFQNMDIIQVHDYNNQNDPVKNASVYAGRHHQFWQSYEKPAYYGEFGTGNSSIVLEYVHYGAWVGLVTGSAITPLDWNDGGSWGDFTPEIYEDLSHFANFVSDIDFIHWDLNIGDVSTSSSFYAWGMVGNEHAFAWILDKSPGEAVESTPITINGLGENIWHAYWYNTWNGEYIKVDYEISDGSLILYSPSFVKDIALKLHKAQLLSQPIALNLQDVPDDQGFVVNLDWIRSIDDTTGGSATNYIIQRKDSGIWNSVDSIDASGLQNYQTQAPTLINSTSEDEFWSIFRVGTKFSSGEVIFSAEDSVQSIDNLPPAVPTNVVLISSPNLGLEWSPNTEEDFSYYSVYRSPTSGFEISQEYLVCDVDTNFYEITVPVGYCGYSYWRITATDIHGNESNGSEEVEFYYTEIALRKTYIPEKFSFENNYPNPFNSTTIIPCSIPEREDVTINIYNFNGSFVRTIWQGNLVPGYYEFSWDGLDNSGCMVSSGIYLFSFNSVKYKGIMKMTFLK